MFLFYGSDILLCHQKCYLAYLQLETLCKHKDVMSYTNKKLQTLSEYLIQKSTVLWVSL